jgi:hypothetical protein
VRVYTIAMRVYTPGMGKCSIVLKNNVFVTKCVPYKPKPYAYALKSEYPVVKCFACIMSR